MTLAKFTILAPYTEASILALARHLHADDRLERLLLPSQQWNLSGARVLSALRREDLSARLRRSDDSPPFEAVAAMPELARLLSRPLRRWTRADGMSTFKQLFDKASVRRAVHWNREVVVGMPGAVMSTFTEARWLLRVLHQVDGLPEVRNRILFELYGRAAAGEMFSRRQIGRLRAEMDSADVVLSPSRTVTTQLQDAGIPLESILTNYYGVSTTQFRAPGVGAAKNKRPHLLYVGQISYRKGIPILLAAARMRRDLNITMVGPVVARELLRSLPSNVKYESSASRSRVAHLMAGADAFIFPTVEDACPLVLFEAASSGLPIITTPAAGSADVLPANDVTFVPVGDAAALSDAMRDATPLELGFRTERAHQYRREVTERGKLNDWDSWAAAVVGGLDGLISSGPRKVRGDS